MIKLISFLRLHDVCYTGVFQCFFERKRHLFNDEQRQTQIDEQQMHFSISLNTALHFPIQYASRTLYQHLWFDWCQYI